MSLLSPRHSCFSRLAISNRSEPEAQGVVGSVVFLLTALDNPGLRRVARTQTASRFPPPVLQGSAVREECACTTVRSRRATGWTPLWLPAPRSLSFCGGRRSWSCSPEEPYSSGSHQMGRDGIGLQAERVNLERHSARSCAEESCSFFCPPSALPLVLSSHSDTRFL